MAIFIKYAVLAVASLSGLLYLVQYDSGTHTPTFVVESPTPSVKTLSKAEQCALDTKKIKENALKAGLKEVENLFGANIKVIDDSLAKIKNDYTPEKIEKLIDEGEALRISRGEQPRPDLRDGVRQMILLDLQKQYDYFTEEKNANFKILADARTSVSKSAEELTNKHYANCLRK